MDLIIVESPTKAKTLSRFLGNKYRIEATMGHIRDLPRSELGVDIESGFTPKYVTSRDKQKQVKKLKDAAKKSDHIILATDPDREGEAIAWHVANIISQKSLPRRQAGKVNPPAGGQKSYDGFERIVFHEITETAIKEALAHPQEIDLKLVNAQQARRILDRLVGYKLSPLLWQKLSRKWLSAGRVQSVTVRLIVEREREIRNFKSVKYYVINGQFKPEIAPDDSLSINCDLYSHNDEKYEIKETHELFDGIYTTTSSRIKDQTQADMIISDLKSPYTVSALDRKEIIRNPAAPYTTSSLQQDAARKLYFSAKKTMQVAQMLYEEGVITYHRTDSVNLAQKFINEARSYISDLYGDKYIPDKPRIFQTKSKVAQEAHEAIRPTDIKLLSENLDSLGSFNRDHVRLYELIWKRALSSQASAAVFDSTTLTIESSNSYKFQVQGSVIKFEGYLKIAGRENNETFIPALKIGEKLSCLNLSSLEHQTQPPPRYSEATLVKALEEKDIGRPSTYAPIISTIAERNYVEKQEKKFIPTELGEAVVDFLVKYFPDILSLPFTAQMESSLDEIANGRTDWIGVISKFYDVFSRTLEETYISAEKVKMAVVEVDEACPTCGSPLVMRIGKYGKFVACSTFPKCRYTRQYFETLNMQCPRCGGDIIIKKSKRGKSFYGCRNYPKCNFAAWKKEDIK